MQALAICDDKSNQERIDVKKYKLTRSVACTHAAFACLVMILASLVCAEVYYPDILIPGEAIALYQNDQGKLENDVISFSFTYQGGILQDATVKSQVMSIYPEVQINEPFTIVIDGMTIKPADLTSSTPVVQRIDAVPDAPRLADRYAGWKIQIQYTATDGAYDVLWEAVLRDESNYIKQRTSITALTRDIDIASLTLVDMDVTDAEVVGLDDGCPVVAHDFFIAYEHPMTIYRLIDDNIEATYTRAQTTLEQGGTLTQSSVVGLVPDNQLRRGFLYYLERERPRPFRQFLHYNSWFDIAHSSRPTLFTETEAVNRVNQYVQEMITERGAFMDGFAMDDPWDNPDSVWQFDPVRNPQEWQNFKAAAEVAGAATGAWMSPFGGYGGFRSRRLSAAAADPIDFETHYGGFMLSGPNYNARYRSVCFDFIRNQGARYFKFDGIGGGLYQSGPATWAIADYEAFFQLVDDLRAEQPDLFINATVGSWHSPYYLMYADSIWRDGQDFGWVGDGSDRQKVINYANREVYRNVVQASPLYPLHAVMSHGVQLAAYAPSGMDPSSNDLGEFTDDIRSYFGAGRGLQEIYSSPDHPDTGAVILTEDMWDVIAEAAIWSREHEDVFADAHWVGGDPGNGDIHGIACWNPQKATLMLRNPSAQVKQIDIDVNQVFELPRGATTVYYMKSPWAEDAAEPAIQLQAGTPYQFTLEPFEVIVLMSKRGDLNGDLQVNIEDIESIGLNWLTCGIIPDCQ